MVVDDQPVFQDAARAVIEATADFALVGEAASGRQALALAADIDPDLVLLDVRMPGIDGFETAAQLRAAHPRTVVVLISAERSPGHPQRVSTAGAAEFVDKQQLAPAVLQRLWNEHRPEGDPGAGRT
jgi:two-component system invasion response regulator UvrY